MDEEMSFPNPVVRTDLPVKKPLWPRVAAGVMVFLLLGTVFLPQILGNRIGRMLLKQYLSSKFNAEVSINGFQTSWFGGTTATELWIKNSDGHVVGAQQLRSDISLLKLLRGKYDLGNCQLTNPLVDWVLDYGDIAHTDTFSRLTGRTPSPLNPLPPLAVSNVSGTITVTGGALNVLRGQVSSGSLFTTFQTMKLTGINGTFTANTAADPWTVALMARAGDDKSQPGTFEAKGSVGFGNGRVYSPAALQLLMTVSAAAVPSAAVVPCLPILSADDARQAIGPVIDSLKLELQARDGKLTCPTFRVTGARGEIKLLPVIDLQANPAVLTLSAQGSIALGVPGGDVRRQLTALNPFVSAAMPGEGTFVLRLTTLSVPLDQRGWRSLSATGELELHELKLSSPAASNLLSPAGTPVGLVTQLNVLTGGTSSAPSLNGGPALFKIDSGNVNMTTSQAMVGDVLLTVAGASGTDGALRMTITLLAAPQLTAAVPELATPSLSLPVPLTGTLDDPRLDVTAMRPSLSAAVLPKLDAHLKTQLAGLRARQSQAVKRPREQAVENLINEFKTTTKPPAE